MLAVVILAAGMGTRMKSDLPKVLHRIRGRPLIDFVLATAQALRPERIVVVVGHRKEEVLAHLSGRGVEWVVQEPQLGTGHAVQQTEALLGDFAGDVVVLSGDVPLLRAETLERLWREHRLKKAAATVLSTVVAEPNAYGRIIRDSEGRFLRIVEAREATPEEMAVREINSGIYCFDRAKLFMALRKIKPDNSKGEYYLTDVIGILLQAGEEVQAIDLADFREVQGINTQEELAEAERALQQ